MNEDKNNSDRLMFVVIGLGPLILLAWLAFAPLLSIAGFLAIGSAMSGRRPMDERGVLAIFGVVLVVVGLAGWVMRPR